jgi:PhnB protein
MPINPIPAGYHSITPFIVAKDTGKLISFLKEAFDATEVDKPVTSPDGTIRHAELKLGDSRVMLSEQCSESPETLAVFYHYVDDADAVYERALKAGATSIQEPTDQFYGDRSGGVKDPSGNQWWIATRKEEVSPEELKRRMAEQSPPVVNKLEIRRSLLAGGIFVS